MSTSTTLLISNLHCSSCVKTIQDTLSALSPPPIAIHTSIISQSVTIEHTQDLHPDDIKLALDDAGFDLVTTPAFENYSLRPSTGPSSWFSRKREKHAEQCMLCSQEHREQPTCYVDGPHYLGDPQKSLFKNTSPIAERSQETLAAPNTSPPQKDVGLGEGPFHATFSVGGMTCASCSGTITETMSGISGVSDVSVNLLGKSATATLERRALVPTVIQAVEDCGFECDVISVEGGTRSANDIQMEEEGGWRTVALRVDGMFCRHCPDKVTESLERFGPKVNILDPLTSYNDQNAILRLSYRPSPPDFTIRTIISAIESSKTPPFRVSVAKPISLEERVRMMHLRELRALLQRLAFCVITAVPTFIIGIVYMSLVPASNPTRTYFMRPTWTGNTSRAQWALFFLATPVMFYSANLFHTRSFKELRSLWRKGSKTPVWKRFVRFGSMNLLVTIGVSIAYFSSIALLALAAAQSPSTEGMGDSTTYFDSVVFLTMFLLAGKCLEAYSKDRTADAISALGRLRPAEALLLVPASTPSTKTNAFGATGKDIEKGDADTDSEVSLKAPPGRRIEKVDVNYLEVGDIVRVLQGSTPPADGIVVSAELSSFDESSLTGESKPVRKEAGDFVYVGTINKGKIVDVKIAAIGGETMLDKIVRVVREGQTKRAPIERVVDLLTGYFVPVITLLAIITWVIWLSLGLSGSLPQDYLDIPIGGWPVWSLEFAIAVFIVACPCGVGLAAPTALLVGSGLAAKFGILVRGGGEAFQEAAQLDVVVFDKTGTLTEGGEPRVTDSHIVHDNTPWSEDELLGMAYALESGSNHPLSIAIKRFCDSKSSMPVTMVDVEETAGKGLKGVIPAFNCTAVIGNEAWIDEHHGVVSTGQKKLLEEWKGQGKSVILLGIQSQAATTNDEFAVVAIFAAADRLRTEARDVVRRLQDQGLGTWMITGDNEKTAQAVAKSVGIPENNVIAGVLPHEKAEKIQWLQQVGMKRPYPKWKSFMGLKRLNERCIVAMVGDGINDAPALTSADVGLAIGSGSDVAISSAAFILVQSNLYGILTLTDLSRKVFNRIKFNFLWAIVYNMAALPIAAGVIYPAGHARLSPVWASLAMALSSVSVVLSSLLLRLYREPKRL